MGERRAALVNRLEMSSPVRRLRAMNEIPVPHMRPETRRELVDLFAVENERLGQLLGRDLSSWMESAPGRL